MRQTSQLQGSSFPFCGNSIQLPKVSTDEKPFLQGHAQKKTLFPAERVGHKISMREAVKYFFNFLKNILKFLIFLNIFQIYVLLQTLDKHVKR